MITKFSVKWFENPMLTETDLEKSHISSFYPDKTKFQFYKIAGFDREAEKNLLIYLYNKLKNKYVFLKRCTHNARGPLKWTIVKSFENQILPNFEKYGGAVYTEKAYIEYFGLPVFAENIETGKRKAYPSYHLKQDIDNWMTDTLTANDDLMLKLMLVNTDIAAIEKSEFETKYHFENHFLIPIDENGKPITETIYKPWQEPILEIYEKLNNKQTA